MDDMPDHRRASPAAPVRSPAGGARNLRAGSMRSLLAGVLCAALVIGCSGGEGALDPAAADQVQPTAGDPETDDAGAGDGGTDDGGTGDERAGDDTNTDDNDNDNDNEHQRDPDGFRCRPDLLPGPDAENDAHEAIDPVDTPVDITVWHLITNDLDVVAEDMVDAFVDQHPWIQVRFENVGSFDEVLRRLGSSDQDSSPDLIMGPADAVRALAESGRFIRPAECNAGTRPEVMSDLLPVIEGTYRVGDELVAVPALVSTPVLVYDRAVWRAAGLDPDRPPTDAAELETAATTLAASGIVASGLTLYDRSGSWFLEHWAAQEQRELVAPGNGHGRPITATDTHTATDTETHTDTSTDTATGTELRAQFTSPEAVETLRWLRRMVEQGAATWIGLNPSGIEDLFALVDPEQPTGMTLNTSAGIGDITRLLSSSTTPFPGVELGIGPLPGPGRGALVGGASWWMVDRSDPVQAGAAWTFASWFLEAPQQALVSTTTGYAPATQRAADQPSVREHWERDPNFEVPYRQLIEAGTTPAALGMQVGPRIELQRLLEIAAGEAIEVGKDPATALDGATALANQLLEVYAGSNRD